MQIPVGVLVDLLNTRVILTIMACACGLTNIVLSLTGSIYVADIARFVMGLSLERMQVAWELRMMLLS